jgi:hypothetical protein
MTRDIDPTESNQIVSFNYMIEKKMTVNKSNLKRKTDNDDQKKRNICQKGRNYEVYFSK